MPAHAPFRPFAGTTRIGAGGRKNAQAEPIPQYDDGGTNRRTLRRVSNDDQVRLAAGFAIDPCDVSHNRGDQQSGRNQAAFPMQIRRDRGRMVSAAAARHGQTLARRQCPKGGCRSRGFQALAYQDKGSKEIAARFSLFTVARTNDGFRPSPCENHSDTAST
jgi:hypothetical protein